MNVHKKNILLGGKVITYEIVIRKNSKNMRIVIGSDGIRVSIPFDVKLDIIERFLFEKKDWILTHYDKSNQIMNRTPLYKGKEIKIIIDKLSCLDEIKFKNNELFINTNGNVEIQEIRNRIKSWYYDEAEIQFKSSLEKYSKLMTVTYNKVTIKEQRSRWGSCSSKGNLNFNWKLILAPTIILDYVVVHELCHLIHMNHSKEFWNMVETYMPDYKNCRKWLRENGSNLFLHIPE